MRISRIVISIGGMMFLFFGTNLVLAQGGAKTAKGKKGKTVIKVQPKTISNSLGMRFAYIPVGTFQMGSNNGDADEQPIHPVTLSRGFYMGWTEVTQGQWEQVMGTTLKQQRDKKDPSSPLYGEGADYPMYYVNWDEVAEFITKLNAKGEVTYRLPTEAEWEYAARAGTTGDYAGDLDSMAWYSSNSENKTHAVATKQPNAWGLYDMHGNVWEWVEDRYGKYDGEKYSNRVNRGGGWFNDANGVRSADRASGDPSVRGRGLGFRLVRN